MTIETTRPTIEFSPPIPAASAGPKPPAPIRVVTAPRGEPLGRDQTSPQAMASATPSPPPPAGSQTGRDQTESATQSVIVSATSIPGDQASDDAQSLAVAGDSDQPTAMGIPISSGDVPSADDPRAATAWPTPKGRTSSGGSEQDRPATKREPSPTQPVSLADPFLALAADVLDDLEKVRIANENRLRQLTRDETDADGEERGFGLTEDHPDVARLAALVDALAKAEHSATLNLQRVMRKHPLGPWVKATAGVGEKQAARLLASIGDPYWNTLHDRPRTVSELWAYCGYHVLPARHDPTESHPSGAGGSNTGHPDQVHDALQGMVVGVAPKRQRGARANWSAAAKMRAYLIAESCIKQRSSPFRPVYDAARTKYADAIHDAPCARCGPKGKPAPVGSPLSDGHKHARAMRAVSKELLKSLWREARHIHETPGGQARSDPHTGPAAGATLQEVQ